MTTLAEYTIKHGLKGLYALAEQVGTTPAYLRKLRYFPARRPSLEMAGKLVEASKGELTFEGLVNPIRKLRYDTESSKASEGASETVVEGEEKKLAKQTGKEA